MEVPLLEGKLDPGQNLLAWTKVSMVGLPLLLWSQRSPSTPKVLVIGCCNCCDLLRFLQFHLPDVRPVAVDVESDSQMEQMVGDLKQHCGLPDGASIAKSHEEAITKALEHGLFDIVLLEASPVREGLEKIIEQARRAVQADGVLCVGGTPAQRLTTLSSKGLLVADASAQDEPEMAETVLLCAEGKKDVSPEAWSAFPLASKLPMELKDSQKEDATWVFWAEASATVEPSTKTVEQAPDEAWDLFGEPAQAPVQPSCTWSRVMEESSERLCSKDFWQGLLSEDLVHKLQVEVPAVTTSVGELEAQGYAVAQPSGPGYKELVQGLLHLVAELSEHLPPAFCYVFEATWRLILAIWPIAEQLLGGECVLEPSFAAFRLNPDKAKKGRYVGNNFAKPHRDYSYEDAIDKEGHLKLLSVWVPLCDITARNGCMYVVPRSEDPHFADSSESLQEPEVPQDSLRALAPHPAGSFMCWSGNTIHWGSSCQKGEDPRTSIALVFRKVGASLSQQERSLTKEDVRNADVRQRLKWIVAAVRFFNHWYDLPKELAAFLARLEKL